MTEVGAEHGVNPYVDGVARELLESWPGRFRFPDVLVALVRRSPSVDAGGDGTTLARAVLACVGGRPPRAVCEELLERGEFDAVEYTLSDCPDLSDHEKGSLTRKLESARIAAGEAVRQRVTTLEQRAEAAGVGFAAPDDDVVNALARSRTSAAAAALDAASAELDARVAPIVQDLEGRLVQQPTTARGSDHTVQRVRALLTAGELVAARALLNREPIGAPIPESIAPLPRWNEEWSAQQILGYHLDLAKPRPPGFAAWEAADDQGITLLTAYDRLSKDPSAGAAEAFADALSCFLGAPGGAAMAQKVEHSPFHLAFFDGLFRNEALSPLHPTGRIDLYVGGPDTTVLPEPTGGQAPHVAVSPGLEPPAYTDRRATAVLSLRDLLQLVVLPDDRGAAVLRILARQWPVTALAGDSAAALAGVLGTEPATAWLTLRWITHLSLGGGLATVQAMENCTGMDPALLRVMLDYAENEAEAAPFELWDVATGGWQGDEALVRALREELVARCDGPAVEAAWWAALSVCDLVDGHVSREDVGDQTEACSGHSSARDEVLAGLDALVACGLLVSATDGTKDLALPLNGVVRTLRPGAEQQLTVLLERLEYERGELRAEPAGAGAVHAAGWSTPWHRNRFATMAAHGDHADAESELDAQDPGALAGVGPGSGAEVALLLRTLEKQCEDQYPEIRWDVRCPPSLRVDMPEAVLRAVLYEVLDNAAEELAAGGGMIQVSVKSVSPEVLVEVQDSGPGLPDTAQGGRRIFLPGWTTRGEGRGGGLYRARRFLRAFATPSVETDVVVFPSEHPTLRGAALRLVLPEHIL
ncbi:ATP-binding protein [Streptomyces cellulosae]|uniref:ATP-binding protein n=1 Tax=Streptomyces cellulosae TaxID=1968 RepID=UPI0004C6C26D|nr:ATP-binding protein [Streptomyces cellulosae]